MATGYYTDGTGAKQRLPVAAHEHPQYATPSHDHYQQPDTGWIDMTPGLIAPWTAFIDVVDPPGDFARPAYRRLAGKVYLKGLLWVGDPATVAALNQNIFVLPEGFRPAESHIVSGATNYTAGVYWVHPQRIDIAVTGVIVPQYVNGTPRTDMWLSISGLSFLAEQ